MTWVVGVVTPWGIVRLLIWSVAWEQPSELRATHGAGGVWGGLRFNGGRLRVGAADSNSCEASKGNLEKLGGPLCGTLSHHGKISPREGLSKPAGFIQARKGRFFVVP